jgi:predicted nucleic acid-binding protein
MVHYALDTNFMVYFEGVNDLERRTKARRLLDTLDPGEVVIPVQALGELFNVLTRKAKWPAAQARAAVLAWTDTYEVIDTTPDVLMDAIELSTTHQLAIRDAIMLAGAAQAGCRVLLSEDMRHGFTWRRATVRNPFGPDPRTEPEGRCRSELRTP